MSEWLPATVPGNVRSDLLALGASPTRFSAMACKPAAGSRAAIGGIAPACRWQLTPVSARFCEFDGVDTLSAVFVDGRELGRHHGMFSRQTLEIPSELAGRAEVELAVRVWGSDALPAYPTNRRERLWGRVAAALGQDSFPPFDDRLATLKRPMSFGWDFAPPLRTMGVWDDARLLVCGSASISDLHVHAEPTIPPTDGGPACVTLRLAIDSDEPHPVIVELQIEPANGNSDASQQFEFLLHLPAGASEHRLTCDLSAARLWQPWERGVPHLYLARVRLCTEEAISRNRALLAERATRFGVRADRDRVTTGRCASTASRSSCAASTGYPWMRCRAGPGGNATNRS